MKLCAQVLSISAWQLLINRVAITTDRCCGNEGWCYITNISCRIVKIFAFSLRTSTIMYWRSQKFWLVGQNGKFLYFLKFDFVIISLKKQNLVTWR